MSENEHDRLKGSIKGDSGRAERLAAELRRNLHRRKARSRALAARTRADDPSAPAMERDPPVD